MRIPSRPRVRRAAGFSLIELVLVVAIILIISAIAIPRFLSSKMRANETGAVSALRSFTAAQVAYQTTYQQGVAPDLQSLGPPPPGDDPSPSRANLIDSLLASGVRSGYVFIYTPVDINGDGTPDSYTLNANPVSPGQTAQKFFYVDQSNLIRFSMDGPAGPTSSPIPSG